jgi:hypothetical protein
VADDVDTLIAEVREIVDVDATAALRLLNRRHRQAVARAQTYFLQVSLEATVVPGAYVLPAGQHGKIVEISNAFTVDGGLTGQVWDTRGREGDWFAYQQGRLAWEGNGLFVPMATGVFLIPPPDLGTSVAALGVGVPPDLVAGGSAATIYLDADGYDALVEGAAATELLRIGEGDPVSMEAKFTAMCEEQRLRERRRLRGPGPAQIRVQGYTA